MENKEKNFVIVNFFYQALSGYNVCDNKQVPVFTDIENKALWLNQSEVKLEIDKLEELGFTNVCIEEEFYGLQEEE